MRHRAVLYACFVAAWVGAILFAGCGAEKTATVEAETAPVPEETAQAEPMAVEPEHQAPIVGAWEATTTGSENFTQFGFEVNAARSGITQLTSGYSDFKCGRVTESVGERTRTFSTPLPITDEGFTTGEPSSNPMMGIGFAVTGEFDGTGTEAQGTWYAAYEGVVCAEGTWEARPMEMESSGGGLVPGVPAP